MSSEPTEEELDKLVWSEDEDIQIRVASLANLASRNLLRFTPFVERVKEKPLMKYGRWSYFVASARSRDKSGRLSETPLLIFRMKKRAGIVSIDLSKVQGQGTRIEELAQELSRTHGGEYISPIQALLQLSKRRPKPIISKGTLDKATLAYNASNTYKHDTKLFEKAYSATVVIEAGGQAIAELEEALNG